MGNKYLLSIFVFLYASVSVSYAGEAVSLALGEFKKIPFKKIPPTINHYQNGVLTFSVDKSASALLLPFKKVRLLKGIRFKWKRKGNLLVKSVSQERSKDGDDSYFRLGLMISGKPPTVPFFASAWVKLTASYMSLPSNKMIYMTVSSKSPAGSRWLSPYSSNISNIVINKSVESGKFHSEYKKFSQPLKVVGLWLMADGDDTGSKFTTQIKELILE